MKYYRIKNLKALKVLSVSQRKTSHKRISLVLISKSFKILFNQYLHRLMNF